MVRGWIPAGLRPRLMLLIAFLVGSSTALTAYQAEQRREAAIRSASLEAALISRFAAATADRALAASRRQLEVLVASNAVRARDAARTQRLLERLREATGDGGHFAAAGPDGHVFASTRPEERGTDASGAAWFRRAADRGEPTILRLDERRVAAGAALRFVVPVRDTAGRALALVSADLETAGLHLVAARARIPWHTSMLVVDGDGVVVAGYPPIAAGRPDSTISIPAGTAGEWMQEARGGDGRPRIVAFARLAGNVRPALFVAVSTNRQAVAADAMRAFGRSLLVMLLVGLVVSFLAWFGVQAGVVRRVEALLSATDRLRAGDLSARTGLPYGRGELSQLARAFDGMAAELQQAGRVRARAEARLRASEAHKAAVVESSLDGILVIGRDGAVLECNAAARRLFGCGDCRCVHHRAGQHFPDIELPAATAAAGPARPVETIGRRMDGSTFPLELGLSRIEDPAGRGQFVATVRDLTERKRWERSIEALTFVDDLTGLYNRRGFFMFATQQMRLAARTGQHAVLVSLDVDGLKAINDTFGHAEGDRAIVETAAIVRRSFRESDVVARFGGDEFVVFATESEAAGAESALERLAREIEDRNGRGDQPWRLGASYGWTRIDPAENPPLAELLAIADARMYEAKRSARTGDRVAGPRAAPGVAGGGRAGRGRGAAQDRPRVAPERAGRGRAARGTG